MSRKLPSSGARVVPTKLAHIVLRTKKYEEAIEWWKTLLLAREAFRNDLVCFMTYDDEHHRLAVIRLPDGAPEAPQGSVGVDHVAFTYASLGDLLFTHRRLRARGVEPYWCINHGPTTSMYYRDPDGNQVELQIDNFPDAESVQEWLQSGTFAKNPIGVVFDPDKLLQKYLEGVPESELIQQGSA